MKFPLLVLLLVACVSLSFAQNRADIKGKVIDSAAKAPLEFATVALVNVKDSTLISYTLSKRTGEFELHNLPLKKDMRLLISFVGYTTFRKVLNFDTGGDKNLGTIELSSKMMDEVVITAERSPVVIKKDTIEFNAEAFKTRPNAVLEELLKKLPGLEVSKDGAITMNGKQVSKLLIDGKEFFGDNPQIATKNLDAEIVSKIQVYDDRQNDPDHLISETKVPKIINIKLKKAIKRSIFGKVFAGGGTRDRYETGGLFNMFRDTLQVSIIGLSNNLNRTAFSNDELYSQGGFNRGGGGGLWDGSVNTGGRNWGGGIERITSGGFNLNTDYGKKLKINLLYFYTQRNNTGQANQSVQQFLNDTTLLSTANYTQKRTDQSHAISGLVEWNPDTLRNIRYTPKITISNSANGYNSFSDTYNNFGRHININEGVSNNKSSSTNFNQDFYFYKRSRTKKGESFNISHNLSINPNRSDNFNDNKLTTFWPTASDSTTKRYVVNDNKSASGSLAVSYRYPITKKLTVDIVNSANYAKNHEQLFTSDFDESTGQYTLLPLQSSDLSRTQWSQTVRPGITYQFTQRISFIAGLSNQWQQIQNDFSYSKLNQRYFFTLPSFRLELGSFSLNFDKSVNQPAVSQLQPVTIEYSPLYKFSGNPNLKPGTNTNASINFYKYNNEKQLGFNTYISYSNSKNTIVQVQNINQTTGARANTFVNRNGRPIYNGYMGINKQFKKTKDLQAGMSTSFNGYYAEYLNIINDDEGWQKTVNLGINQNFNLGWKEKIDFNAGAGFRRNFTKYDYGNLNQVNANTYNINTNLIVRLPKKLVWETKQDYNYNSQISDGFRKGVNVISTSLALQMLKKDRGELKVTVYDLFDQNINVYRFASANSIIDMQNTTLKRYFLLTYSYKFNKMSTK
ncbi:MAG: TonB-dependent receptor [Sphingobacteriaceae bacterium]|nr:MAG: TonB-dependent receptor [Sphingobacteriaceae bacterium]